MRTPKKQPKPAKHSRKPIFDRALEHGERQLEKAKADYAKYSAKATKALSDIPKLESIIAALRGESNIGPAEPGTRVDVPYVPSSPEALMQKLGVKPRRSGELLGDLPVVGAPPTNDDSFLPDVD